ncbi:MAG TPA: GNAT family protein [Casimicrobiaceae bacterium]|nr:GNAT family protein [Casimicrobiaceae bacterium]
MRTRFIEPVTLRGDHALLEPLERSHESALREAAADGELWKLWYTSVPTPDGVAAYIDTALALRDAGEAMPFVVRDSAGRIVGSTRYLNIVPEHRRVEIGNTWYARSAQRTALNTECKFLLLTQAFETLGCIAVEFRTNWFNRVSRRAIERLGAKRDGVLRNHQILPDGSFRDTVVYSIIESEWPGVRRQLRFMLEAGQ